MKRKLRLPSLLAFKCTAEDEDFVRELMEKLSLPRGEVLRRSVRLGLMNLEHINLPGSHLERRYRQDESSA